jgi:hypothetical protein
MMAETFGTTMPHFVDVRVDLLTGWLHPVLAPLPPVSRVNYFHCCISLVPV